MPLTKLRKHNPVKLLFLMSVMPKTERIIFMLTIPFLFCFSFSENGRRNAAESILYLWALPAADYGQKITHLLSVLQPKGIVFTKGYLKTAQQ